MTIHWVFGFHINLAWQTDQVSRSAARKKKFTDNPLSLFLESCCFSCLGEHTEKVLGRGPSWPPGRGKWKLLAQLPGIGTLYVAGARDRHPALVAERRVAAAQFAFPMAKKVYRFPRGPPAWLGCFFEVFHDLGGQTTNQIYDDSIFTLVGCFVVVVVNSLLKKACAQQSEAKAAISHCDTRCTGMCCACDLHFLKHYEATPEIFCQWKKWELVIDIPTIPTQIPTASCSHDLKNQPNAPSSAHLAKIIFWGLFLSHFAPHTSQCALCIPPQTSNSTLV